MTNQEIITKVEEWVDDNEYYTDEIHVVGSWPEEGDFYMVKSQSLITFIKKLLHE